jgi:hypothetical protein
MRKPIIRAQVIRAMPARAPTTAPAITPELGPPFAIRLSLVSSVWLAESLSSVEVAEKTVAPGNVG